MRLPAEVGTRLPVSPSAFVVVVCPANATVAFGERLGLSLGGVIDDLGCEPLLHRRGARHNQAERVGGRLARPDGGQQDLLAAVQLDPADPRRCRHVVDEHRPVGVRGVVVVGLAEDPRHLPVGQARAPAARPRPLGGAVQRAGAAVRRARVPALLDDPAAGLHGACRPAASLTSLRSEPSPSVLSRRRAPSSPAIRTETSASSVAPKANVCL